MRLEMAYIFRRSGLEIRRSVEQVLKDRKYALSLEETLQEGEKAKQ